jgi:hypothetical protein
MGARLAHWPHLNCCAAVLVLRLCETSSWCGWLTCARDAEWCLARSLIYHQLGLCCGCAVAFGSHARDDVCGDVLGLLCGMAMDHGETGLGGGGV